MLVKYLELNTCLNDLLALISMCSTWFVVQPEGSSPPICGKWIAVSGLMGSRQYQWGPEEIRLQFWPCRVKSCISTDNMPEICLLTVQPDIRFTCLRCLSKPFKAWSVSQWPFVRQPAVLILQRQVHVTLQADIRAQLQVFRYSWSLLLKHTSKCFAGSQIKCSSLLPLRWTGLKKKKKAEELYM